MPLSWHYPRLRRILTQATLWLALIATTALAALVVHQRQTISQISLTRPLTIGPISVRLPADWTLTRGNPRSTVLLRAEEPLAQSDDPNQTPPPPRTLVIRLFRNVDDDSATNFLRHSGLLQRAAGTPTPDSADDDNPDLPPLPSATRISIDGVTGILVRIYRIEMPTDEGQEPSRQAEWIAAALVSGSRAVVLQLESPDPDDNSSQTLVRSIAASIRVAAIKPSPDQPLPSDSERL